MVFLGSTDFSTSKCQQQCQLLLLPVVFPWSTNRCLERKLNFYATQPTTCDFQASLAWKRRPPTCQTTACLTNDISQWNWETKRRRRDCRTSSSLQARPSIHFLSRLGWRRWCRFCLLQGRLYHHHLLIGLEWHSSDLRWSCGRSLLFNLGPYFLPKVAKTISTLFYLCQTDKNDTFLCVAETWTSDTNEAVKTSDLYLPLRYFFQSGRCVTLFSLRATSSEYYLARYQRRRKRRRQMTPIDLADESAHIFRQTQQTRYNIDNIVKFDISGNCIKVTIANG